MQAKNFIQYLFWWLAGADAEILSRPECRTERKKYTNMGMIVLSTSILGGISGGYALMSVFGSPVVAAILGTFWGGITINMDRSFLTSSKNSTSFLAKVRMAAPRLILASMLGLIISKPLELRLFQAEIVQQLAKDQQTNSLEGQAISQLKDARTLKGKEVNVAREQWKIDNQVAIAEATGESGTGYPGPGLVYDLKQSIAAKSLTVLKERERELRRINQKIDSQESQLDTLTQQTLNGQASLLEQLRALSELSANSATLALTINVITLLFVTLEITPVLVKLMSQSGPYDDFLMAEQEQVKKLSELEALEAQELREEAFLLRRQLREGRFQKILMLIREVIDTQFSEAMQKMIIRPEYAQEFDKVMDILQQNLTATLVAEAQMVSIYDSQDIQKTMQQTNMNLIQQRTEQRAQQQWMKSQLSSLKQEILKMDEITSKVNVQEDLFETSISAEEAA